MTAEEVKPVNLPADGMNLLVPDVTTEEEISQFRAFYSVAKKAQNLSYEFWLEFRPDVLKRHKSRTATYYVGARAPIGAMAALHQYIITAFDDGIGYELQLAQTLGASRTDLLDLISIAFIHSGHPGMYLVSRHADFLRDFETHDRSHAYPSNWYFDPQVLASGMDYSSMEATPADCRHLVDWYERVIGEVPRHVRFLASHRPDLLKAYRNRYEHAIRDSLPVQMMPYLMLHYNVVRGSSDGIRENVLLARALGMTKEQVLNAICSAVLHAGEEAFTVVDLAVGDLLDSFPEGVSS
jgi:hypothetical protein